MPRGGEIILKGIIVAPYLHLQNADPETYMDKVVEVKILDLDHERQRLVVSQRAAAPKMAAESFKVLPLAYSVCIYAIQGS